MRQISAILSIVLGVGIVAPFVVAAQVSTGQISGRVTDTSGAVLPGVSVTATQTDTQAVRTTVTNEVGAFTLANLPVGPYRLEASLQGFQTFASVRHHGAGERQPCGRPHTAAGRRRRDDHGAGAAVGHRSRNAPHGRRHRRRTGAHPRAAAQRATGHGPDHALRRRRAGAELRHRQYGDRRQHLRRRRRPLGRAVSAGRRDQQQPVGRDQHAAAVPGRAAGVPHQHERAGGGGRPSVRRVGQRRDESRDEPVPRQRLLVRARHALQRPRGARGHQGQAAAESARRLRSADRSCRTGCSSSPATRARFSIRRCPTRCRSCRRRPCWPATGGHSTVPQPAHGATPTSWTVSSIHRATARPRCVWPRACRNRRVASTVRRAALGQPHRSPRQADGDAHRLPAQRRASRSTAATWRRCTISRSRSTRTTC